MPVGGIAYVPEESAHPIAPSIKEHGRGVDEPAGHEEPKGHCIGGESLVGQYDPAGHGTEAEADVTDPPAQNFPAGH